MDVIEEFLVENRVQTAWGLELPDHDQLVEVEEELLMPLPGEFRRYLLTLSDTIYGTIEPVTAADPNSHTYIVDATAECWEAGMPRTHLCICKMNQGAWAIDQDGEVSWWLEGTEEMAQDPIYESWWHWVRDIWLDRAL